MGSSLTLQRSAWLDPKQIGDRRLTLLDNSNERKPR